MAGGLGAAGALMLSGCAQGDDVVEVAPGQGLLAIGELEVGESASVQTQEGATVLLTRTGQEEAVAFSAVCTHEGCTVAVGETEGECPCHGSRFDLTTGEATARPAQDPLAPIEVRVVDGEIRTA